MKTIQVTQHEINQATRPNVYKNKKKYTRKGKLGKWRMEDWFVYSGYKIKVMLGSIVYLVLLFGMLGSVNYLINKFG